MLVPHGLGLHAAAAALLLTVVLPAPGRAHPDDFIKLTRQALPAVVNISTSSRARSPEADLQLPELPPGFEEFFGNDFFERFFGRPPQSNGRQPRRASLGSGFVVDPEGYVVTNNHVVEGADEITVILHDETELEATVVGRDPKTDLALIKVESERPLPFVEWGDSDDLQIGEWVVAIGNPFGLGGTVTAGIVSQRSRDINSGPYDDFIQTDAAINRGNSGGPLFNGDGEVVGVNTAIFSPSGGSIGIGFAIPAKLAQPVIDQLRQNGDVKRGWLGVSIQPITGELAEALALPVERGALVASVDEESPAKAAGIQTGDVILSFDDKEIEDPRGLARTVADTPAGKAVEVELWRNRAALVVEVQVGVLGSDQAARAAPAPSVKPAPKGQGELFGMSLSELTPDLRRRHGLAEDAEGVLVQGIEPGSQAAERGLRSGDLISQLGERDVENLADIAAALATAEDAGEDSVLVLVERAGNPLFLTLPVVPDAG
ncbi:MAG: DegQ family serine endoprotease [Pseudomonadota bacterium]